MMLSAGFEVAAERKVRMRVIWGMMVADGVFGRET